MYKSLSKMFFDIKIFYKYLANIVLTFIFNDKEEFKLYILSIMSYQKIKFIYVF